MASALEDKVDDLKQMEARARQFAGDVSHELRTPLTAMTAVVGILHEHPGLTGDAARAARLVGQELKHLNRLVEDLIEISRFDVGTVQLVTDETDVARAVSQCLRARGWSSVSTDVPAGLAARLDRRRFDVILANLVGNALRHGGPPVTVQARIQSGGQCGAQLAVEVRDHGHGLPLRRSRTYSTGSIKLTRHGRVPTEAAWAWRSPGRTPACTAVTSTRATTRTAARCSS
jgi:two-component system sensor histidine kinase MtrB